ncbi:MAG: putative nucleotidyltransferase component of viral defense system [Alteromonadaceae bacterium]|jgi:predicted nucleotidyltransferase component of viral defense system
MKKISLTERAKLIAAGDPTLTTMVNVIEKELLHYDIFYLLQQENLILPEMTFIGGTCLRLCHQSNRYSEDLDFHAGSNFNPLDFDNIRLAIERYLYDRYGLPVEVRSPKQLKNDPDYANSNANTWKVIIQTHPEARNVPSQRVHIDIANIIVRGASPLLINTNYDKLPDGYNSMLIKAASLNEILADKLLSVPARNNIKARDLWDIIWLQQQNVKLDITLLKQKITDHSMTNFKNRLELRLNEMPTYFQTDHFSKEMSRFLDSQRLAQTVNKPEFIQFVSDKIQQTLTNTHQQLYSENDNQFQL